MYIRYKWPIVLSYDSDLYAFITLIDLNIYGHYFCICLYHVNQFNI